MPPPTLTTGQHEMDTSIMIGGDSLDDIIMQNNQELQRRQSLPNQYGDGISIQNDDRRGSMMEFGSGTDNLNGFQFGAQNTSSTIRSGSRRQSVHDLDMGIYPDMTADMGMGGAPADFSASLQQNQLTIDTTGSYGLSADLMDNLMYQNMGMGDMEDGSMNMYGPNDFQNPYSSGIGQIPPDYGLDMGNSADPNSAGSNDRQSMSTDGLEDDMIMSVPGLGMTEANNGNGISLISAEQNVTTAFSPTTVSRTPKAPVTYLPSPALKVDPGSPTQPRRAVKPTYQNVYSASGFDMLKALMRVATRKNPEINIGAVDMSCAFVVCDVTQNDCPIIYVSDIFERLTGYTKHEVLGQNCRFLQAPDGKVVAGVNRKYVDDNSVHYLKTRIQNKKEAQISLINYRKGGQPFMNLLTMIPISWEDSEDVRYFVGFQVDLVEQPSSIANKNPSGSYTVNYSQGLLPRYVWTPPDVLRPGMESGQTISRDDVSAVLANFNNTSDGEVSKRMWDKVLLENTDDVVHVLSLKGLFLYLSPSCKSVLEYDSSELVGTALSSVCHPSDIVPVTRELKDSSTGATVNVVFRIRRKKSGYTWFESHGSLYVEQGKGRKCIILVGRERPVYALARSDLEAAGGIGENELWTKLSTSGMLLFISSTVRNLLDRQPDDLVGTSIQALMRPESKVDFNRLLERARTGKRVVFMHEIMNRKGQTLQAQTTLFPGDAAEGSKPTFLVGQTRLVKQASRNVTSAMSPNSLRITTSMGKQEGDSPPVSRTSPQESRGDTTPRSTTSSVIRERVVTQAGGGALPIGTQDAALASEDNIFDELKTTRCTSWQFELRQMEKSNRILQEELQSLMQNKKKRKRRKGVGGLQRDCANCHTRSTPEWRRGPSGNRDLCNSCGLRWAKQVSLDSSEFEAARKLQATWSSSDSS
jgi:PAS domain S-box-containing protein